MKVYRIEGTSGYDFLNDAHALKLVDLFSDHQGEPLSGTWQLTEVVVEARSSGKGPRKLKRSDLFPHCLPRLAMTRAASEALADLLLPNGELLPLIASDGQDLVLHNTRVVDCLDYDRSDIKRFRSGEIMVIEKAVFRGELVEGFDIFCLPMGFRVYVSERFVEAVTVLELRGADFEPCEVVYAEGSVPAAGEASTKTIVAGAGMTSLTSMDLVKAPLGSATENPNPEAGLLTGDDALVPEHFLDAAWKLVADEEDDSWIDRQIADYRKHPDRPYAGSGRALDRLLALGADRRDLVDLVRASQAEMLFSFCSLLDDPGQDGGGYAGRWALVTTDQDGEPTDEIIDALHEGVLGGDPTGREMRPRPAD